jgi:hypothetical protein
MNVEKLTTPALIRRIEAAGDFDYDDEAAELCHRLKKSRQGWRWVQDDKIEVFDWDSGLAHEIIAVDDFGKHHEAYRIDIIDTLSNALVFRDYTSTRQVAEKVAEAYKRGQDVYNKTDDSAGNRFNGFISAAKSFNGARAKSARARLEE